MGQILLIFKNLMNQASDFVCLITHASLMTIFIEESDDFNLINRFDNSLKSSCIIPLDLHFFTKKVYELIFFLSQIYIMLQFYYRHYSVTKVLCFNFLRNGTLIAVMRFCGADGLLSMNGIFCYRIPLNNIREMENSLISGMPVILQVIIELVAIAAWSILICILCEWLIF